MIVYTSGTTAEPKGVLHTHNTLLAEKGGAAAVRARTPTSDRPDLQLFPAGHIAGALGTIFLFSGAPTTVAFDSFDAEQAIAAIEELGAASTSGATVFLARMVELLESGAATLEGLEHFIVGAATVPPELVERADALGIRATRCYGSSEHPTVTLSAPGEPLWVRARTDGPALPGNELRIVDDEGRELEAGAEGEIITRGPELFVGYLDERLNRSAFLEEGWFRTGDVGRLEKGLLVVTDRKKDIIIRGGENISASEVEAVLGRLDAVLESAVVAAPDPSLGERVCAFVVLRSGAQLSLDEVRSHFTDAGLARQKTPEQLIAVEALPRTASGKVQKELLRLRLREPAEAG
jgi:acyl-CoA synthetase (AMP-forming)/AMP-acid ligase II